MTGQRQLLRERGICVVIPTYNNGGTISRVVSEVLEQCADVIVVNDGSTDDTGLLLHTIDGITIVEYERNRGKGHALKAGFRKARAMGFAYAITLDADGQHYPADIALLLRANCEHPGALIVGKRNLEGVERSGGSKFANAFANFWFAVQTLHYLPDTQTGFRLYPLKKLYGLPLLTSRYEAELELLVMASWHGVPLRSIPVSVYYPPQSERVSHFRPALDFARISLLNCVLCLLAVVYALPLGLLRLLLAAGRTAYCLLVFMFFSLFVFTPGVWLFVMTRRMTEQRRLMLHRLIQRTARFVMQQHGIPGTTFACKGGEQADFSRPHVIICNHQSHLDLMCQLLLTPKIVFLTNDWVWHSPFFGFIVRSAEFCPVSEGIDVLMPRLRSLAERGYSIAVYPEGTRSPHCRIARFHRGAFHIAEQLGLDVLPMYLYGTGRVLPKGGLYLRKGPVCLEVGTAFSREQLQAMGDTLQQARTLRSHYAEHYQQMANKIEQDV